ncbi:VgrG-related protein [Deinococcus maricopensis]|uniref:Rhs element Vgr protein n=1 Tax=Deinococcus maricopensis (strain DSM 21211 / LMG 22137 / NRRL B-23946 / LB-34) TaxID=709986 RepID=E8U3P5_DEIML|nr:VgrG-related protein [Deinococcus maricopensis]ADV68669.1 Rhs element Vgr protein [Deinococcus maricopensis DSM 21211]
MTAQNTITGATSNLFVLFGGGSPDMKLMHALEEVTVESSLHLPDIATITFRDPDVDLIESPAFKLGATVQVKAKVGGNEETVFDGELVEVEPRYTRHNQKLRLRAFDRMHRLARGTHTRSFQNVSDMDLVKKLAGEAGMQAKVGPASFVHPYILQHNQTNLAFLRERAARLGYVLYADGKTLHCEPPTGPDKIELTWGNDLVEFAPRLSSIQQTTRTVVRGWDPKQKRAVVGQADTGNGKVSVGDSSTSEQVAPQAFNMPAPETQSTVIVRDQSYATAIAQAERNRRAEGLIEATGVCGGYPKLTAGTTLTIKNVGKRFEGDYVASSVRHQYRTDRGYFTEFTVSGSRPDTIPALLRASTSGTSANSTATGTTGLMIGIVTNNDDPENQGRVKVKLPALTEQDESDWARVISVGGGPNRGFQYTPEVNDEVLVAFEHGDIHHPYVIGGLWNGQDKPPKPTKEVVKGGKVIQRVMKSRTGHEFIIDDSDDKPHIQLRTKQGHEITLHDDKKKPYVLVKDQSGNEVYIDTKQNLVRVTSKGKLELKAQRGVLIDGGGGNVDVKGVMINLN